MNKDSIIAAFEKFIERVDSVADAVNTSLLDDYVAEARSAIAAYGTESVPTNECEKLAKWLREEALNWEVGDSDYPSGLPDEHTLAQENLNRAADILEQRIDFWVIDALSKLRDASMRFRLGNYSSEELEIFEDRADRVLRSVGDKFQLDAPKEGNELYQPTELRESLASYAHDAWSGWMSYLFGRSTRNTDGTVTIPKWAVERWDRQVSTPYKDLSESEKESDRAEADKMIETMVNQPSPDKELEALCQWLMNNSSGAYRPAAHAAFLLRKYEWLARDAVNGLRYIEESYGRLYGVGWDRVFDAADKLIPGSRLWS